VLGRATGSKIWATISYGWESADFYKRWSVAGGDPIEMQGPCLDPMNPQTQYSSALIELFRLLLQSTEYVERLKRHYRMFRESVEKGVGRQGSVTVKRIEQDRKRLRELRRRRRNSR
jgi:hypothetical protein